jgi:hypothetical protein
MIKINLLRLAKEAELNSEDTGALSKFVTLVFSYERDLWKKRVERAVRDEREVCAKMADSISKDSILSAAIRYRNNI